MRNIRRYAAVFLGVALLVISAGCGCLGKCRPAERDLYACTWELDDDMPGAPYLPKKTPDVTLRLRNDGTYSGFAGVNIYRGKFTVDPIQQTIKFDQPQARTRMSGPALQFEQYFLERLTAVDSYCWEDGDELILLSKGRLVAKFEHQD